MRNFKVALGKFLNKHAAVITVVLVMTLVVSMTVFGASADVLWNTLANEIKKWVNRLGAVIIFVGGIMFALGWKSDDAEQKSKGISTVIAGGLVIAIAQLTGTFFV
ncbi:MAG: hypothetical protein E7290_10215 [Lachnospiraceae bacterium]|nr:hypothetical protein [Lachnospiraceae bacterium]